MEIGSEMPIVSLKVKIITTIVAGVFYGGALYLFNLLLDEPLFNTNLLLIQGLSFGFFMGFGIPYINKRFGNKRIAAVGKSIELELSENETIDYEGPANLFRGLESVGGKLFLTNQKIIFKAYKLNIQRGQTNIEFHDVLECKGRKTGGIIDNGIHIKTKDGKEFDFVVNDREKWLGKFCEKLDF